MKNPEVLFDTIVDSFLSDRKTIYNADEEQILQQDLKVKVKKNATDVTVTGIADGAVYYLRKKASLNGRSFLHL